MNASEKLRNKDFVSRERSTHYEEPALWLHNYITSNDIKEEEKQHLKDVMIRDQQLKKADAERISRLSCILPSKMRPELLSAEFEKICDMPSPLPGSGHVSLSSQLPFDRPQSAVIVDENDLQDSSNINNFFNSVSDLFGRALGRYNRSMPTENDGNRCANCYAKIGLFESKRTCCHCSRVSCKRCATLLNNDLILCKDCADVARALGKTGDWFTQYLSSKEATPLRIEGGGSDAINSKRTSRFFTHREEERGTPDITKPQPRPISRYRSCENLPNADNKPPQNKAAFKSKTLDKRLSSGDFGDDTEMTAHVEIKPNKTHHTRKISRKKHQRHRSAEDLSKEKVNGDTTVTISDGRKKHKHEDSDTTRKLSKCEDSSEKTTDCNIQLVVEYDIGEKKLLVNLLKANNLNIVGNKKEKCHIIANVFLYPDPEGRTKQKIIGTVVNANCTFDHGVCYSLSTNEIHEKTIVIELWRKTKMKSAMILGQAVFPLKDYKWAETYRGLLPIGPKENNISTSRSTSIYRGEITIEMRYNVDEISQAHPATSDEIPGTLEIRLIEGNNLQSDTTGVNITSFVKATLLSDSSQLETKSTHSMPRTNNPRWNSIIRFTELIRSDLKRLALELSVWNHPTARKAPEFLGGIRLANNSDTKKSKSKPCSADEMNFWSELNKRLDCWIGIKLPLHELA